MLRKRREGKGREGKGRDGKGRKEKRREGKGRDGAGRAPDFCSTAVRPVWKPWPWAYVCEKQFMLY